MNLELWEERLPCFMSVFATPLFLDAWDCSFDKKAITNLPKRCQQVSKTTQQSNTQHMHSSCHKFTNGKYSKESRKFYLKHKTWHHFWKLISFLCWECVQNEVTVMHKIYQRKIQLTGHVMHCFHQNLHSKMFELIQTSRLWKTRSNIKHIAFDHCEIKD